MGGSHLVRNEMRLKPYTVPCPALAPCLGLALNHTTPHHATPRRPKVWISLQRKLFFSTEGLTVDEVHTRQQIAGLASTCLTSCIRSIGINSLDKCVSACFLGGYS